MLPTPAELQQKFQARYGDTTHHGWRVRMRHRFAYVSPEFVYETLVSSMVRADTRWLDVGGGKSVFPDNSVLAASLAGRCRLLVGVDPSDTILENHLIHERVQCPIEQYSTSTRFDLVTLRMVAEHISLPRETVAALARLMAPDGKVVVYTPNKWSPASITARMVPNDWHPMVTRLLWRTKEEDVFPTVYRMNTRRDLAAAFSLGGFREVGFAYLDACSLGQRFRATCFMELLAWRLLRVVGLHYPETNLLGLYELSEHSGQQTTPEVSARS